MSNFFRHFPLEFYTFGDGLDPVVFQNISAYVALIDEIADETTYYNTIFIRDYERADALSQRLYGTPDYHWTFYFLNHDVRESGWPVNELELTTKAQTDYPHRTIVTAADIADTFLIGHTVTGVSSGTVGVVVKRFLDLGQIVVRIETAGETYSDGESIDPTPPGEAIQTDDRITVTSEVAQYLSVHHYENTAGDWLDIDPHAPDLSGKLPITYLDRVTAKNNSLKEIKVFKEDVVPQIASEFQKLLLRNS